MEGAVRPAYRAYMLRLRRTGDTHPVWRVSLEEVTGGGVTLFPSLEAMLAWLKEQIGEQAEGQGTQRLGPGHDAQSGGGTM